ncbi:hypothetical protein E1I69_04060 [Bacillus timonensis]|uniref:Flagellar hook-length control protein FliK n=1 Tax=Bacillus timonensis TaxID=1033734 RepID=A0A4S3PXV5_9BACI|nr:hypothetical protein [Bacillus timonensis]THE14454.1 hypothetical protein E1I69_04060 [Bacillus timonensis]
MIPIHLLQILMKSEAFQKLHSLSNANPTEQKTQNATGHLPNLLPVGGEEIADNIVNHSRMLQTDTVELTSSDSTQFLQQQFTFQNSANQTISIRMDGRKKNGKIDPAFCHLLFSLELHELKEVVIDVKVQNRILSISIFNDREGIELLVEELKPTLHTNLEKQGYLLSSIKIVNPIARDNQYEKTGFEEVHEKVDVKI